MHYGHPPHRNSPEDLTILWCRCGWVSEELSRNAIRDRGVPWYCDDCGKPNLMFISFHPTERAAALREVPMAKPTLIKPNGAPAGMSPAQLECVEKLEEALESAKNGDIFAMLLVAVGPADFGIAIAGSDAPRLNLGLDAAKTEIMSRVLGPRRSVLHR